MKTALRIALFLTAILICVVALWPTGASPEETSPPSPADQAESSETPRGQGLVRDALGGAALDAGKRAQSKISEINQQRQSRIEDLSPDDPETDETQP